MTTQTEPPNDGTAHLSRRVFLKTTGAAAGAAAAGAGTTGLAAADDNGDGLLFNPNSPTLPGLSAASTISDWIGDTGGTDATEVALHQTAISQQQDLDLIEVMMDNNLEDMSTMASIEARHQIASEWEDANDSESARGAAIDAIYDYYAYRQINVIEGAMKAMVELSHIAHTARQHDDIDDEFVSPTVPDYSGTAEPETWTIRSYADAEDDPEEGFPETSFTLVNDDEHNTVCPELEFTFDNGDEWVGPLDDEWVEGWTDETANILDEVELTTEDGETLTSTFNVGVNNVPDADLEGARVFEIADMFISLLVEIDDQSSEVAGNYDLNFVDELYEALDEGSVTPDEVRGIEGTARHLSGSTEATESRYQMAILNQLGVERGDLSEVASMTLDYSGYLSRRVERDEETVSQILADHTDDRTAAGQLFASLFGATTLSAGDSYAASPSLIGLRSDYDDDDRPEWIEVYDATSGTIRTEIDFGDYISRTAVSADGQRLVLADNDNNLYLYDLGTGERISEIDQPYGDENILDMSMGSDRRLALGNVNDELAVLDMSDDAGDEIMQIVLDDRPEDVRFAPDGETVLVTGTFEYDIGAYDAETGSVEWEMTIDEEPGDTRIAPDSEKFAYLTDVDELVVRDLDSGDEIVTTDLSNSNNLAWHPTSDEIAVGYDDDGTVGRYDVSDDLSELHSASVGEGDVDVTYPDPHHIAVVEDDGAGDATYRICDLDGDVIVESAIDADGNDLSDPIVTPRTKFNEIDGTISSATAYDAAEGESLDLVHGLVELTELTNADGEEIDEDQEIGWERPQYDTYDVDEYATYIEKVNEEYTEALSDHGDPDDGFSWPWTGDDSLGDRQMLAAGAGIVAVLAGLAHSLSEGDDRDYRR